MIKSRGLQPRPMLPIVSDSEEIALRQLEDAVSNYKDREESAIYCELAAIDDIETLKADFEEHLPYVRAIIREKLDDVLGKRFIDGVSRHSAVYKEIEQDAWCWAWKAFAFEINNGKPAKKRVQYSAYTGCKRALSGRQWESPKLTVDDQTISQSELHPNPDTAEFIIDQLFSGSGDGEPSAEDLLNSAETIEMVYKRFGTTTADMVSYRELFDPKQLVEIVGQQAVIVSLIIEGFGLTEIWQQLGYKGKFRSHGRSSMTLAVESLKDEFSLADCIDDIKDKLSWSLTVKEIIDWSHQTSNQIVCV